jgi:ubiquitin-activating enzyme E1
MSELRILIVGVKGTGVETAKNLILSTSKAVTVWDNGIVEPKDLGTNFYLKESDIGK